MSLSIQRGEKEERLNKKQRRGGGIEINGRGIVPDRLMKKMAKGETFGNIGEPRRDQPLQRGAKRTALVKTENVSALLIALRIRQRGGGCMTLPS